MGAADGCIRPDRGGLVPQGCHRHIRNDLAQTVVRQEGAELGGRPGRAGADLVVRVLGGDGAEASQPSPGAGRQSEPGVTDVQMESGPDGATTTLRLVSRSVSMAADRRETSADSVA